MKVILAGYNIEAEMVRKAAEGIDSELTPEVISAAYARISRDPRNVDTLRKEARADVARARRSNESIVFEMGHSSVAEHAVFNFDVMNVSRLAVEEIEHFRLASYTEKSQRYIRLGRDRVFPAELKNTGIENDFNLLMSDLAEAYASLYGKISASGEEKSVAKEDARYLMPLATSAQFGMTINARELEYMISRLSSHRLDELRRFALNLSKLARKIAPSIVRYPEPTDYFRAFPEARGRIGESARIGMMRKRGPVPASGGGREGDSVRLLDFTRDGDGKLAAGLIFSSGTMSFEEAERIAAGMDAAKRRSIISETMRCIKPHDSVWREFETIHMLFEVVTSASCFAQLKRHRMASIIKQPYSTDLGVTIPDSVRRAGAVTIFREFTDRASTLYERISRIDPEVAPYGLTNAHRRRIIIGINMREMYHFSRLRSDSHAQWEIRNISEKMSSIASEIYPCASILICGKDGFNDKKMAADI